MQVVKLITHMDLVYMSPSDMILQINTISGYYYRNDEFLPIYEQYKSKQLSSKDIV